MQKIKEYFRNNWLIITNLIIYPLLLFVPIYFQQIYAEGTLELQGYVNFYQFFSFVNPIYSAFSIFLIVGIILYLSYFIILFLRNINYYKLYLFKRYIKYILIIISGFLLLISISLLIVIIIFVSTQARNTSLFEHYYYFKIGTIILFLYSLINFTITILLSKKEKL